MTIREVTFDAALDRFPLWSPDGSRIVFDSNRKGVQHLYMKPSSGGGSDELLLESPQETNPSSGSEDGRLESIRDGGPTAKSCSTSGRTAR